MSRKQAGLRFQPACGVRQAGPQVGKKQQLTIERLAHDGRGIVFYGGRTWFVSGALVGEQVVARVLSVRNKLVDAIAERIEQPAASRIQPFCQLAGRCGGCTLQHMPLTQQRELKQQHLAEQIQRVGVQVRQWAPMLAGQGKAYRRRVRIAVKQDKNGHLHIGFRALASQQIVEARQCPVLVPELQQCLPALHSLLHSLGQPHAIGHLELFSGNQVALLVRCTQPMTAADQKRFIVFAEQWSLQLWWQDKGEAYAQTPQHRLFYPLTPYTMQVHCQPGDFVQVNEQMNLAMLQQALNWLDVQAHERILDLFCGLGNFTLPLARQAAEVVAVEGVAAMLERARDNATRQGLASVHFYHYDLSQPLLDAPWAAQEFSSIVLDPPRDGAAQLVAQLTKLAARKVLYVSCNPATLARDSVALIKQGYRLERLGALDMFSHTSHVEAMALFTRVAV